MKICLIQLKAKVGDVSHNIANHLLWIETVGIYNPDLIVFPELSITGYDVSIANKLAFQSNDARFNVFQSASDKLDCTIAIGIPLKVFLGVQIAMLIFQPGKSRITYAKQLLHEDESPYFLPSISQNIISINNTRIAPAICYESLTPSHLANCLALHTDIYLASVSKHDKGIIDAHEYYRDIAKRNSLPVLVVNSVGYCDSFLSAGQSAVWDLKGYLVKQLNSKEEGFITYDYVP